MNKQENLERLTSARERLDAAITRLTVEQLTRPGGCGEWSVKDILAHVVFWEQDLLRGYASLRRGEAVREYSDQEINAVNARVRRENFTRPLAEVMDEARASFRQVSAWLAVLEEDELARPYAYGLTLGEFIKVDTWEHYEEHVPPIETLDC